MFEHEIGDRPPQELEDEATALRHQLAERSQILEPKHMPLWKRVIFLVLLIGTIAAAVYLLIFQDTRQQILAGLTESWMDVYQGREADLLLLPPPPPREVEPQVRYPDTFSSSDDEFDGVLFSSSASSLAIGTDDEELEEDPGFVSPAKTDESQKAFEFLTQNSQMAKDLTENLLDEYEFQEWKPVRNDPPLFFVDLVVTQKSDSRELHLVWEVDLENSSVRALSQAARDLEGKSKE